MTLPPADRLGPADPSRLGEYALLGVLGAGGMGRVYLGRSATGRLVAVKVIRRELLPDEQYRRRFRSEVERARQVPSFSTAEVLGADPDHEPPYLVVEYIEGPSLAEIVAKSGPFGASHLHGLAVGLAGALRAIHDAGVIHRDLKPSNVLLSPTGPKVIDFGIARATADPVPLTLDNQRLGSIPYMSPERFYGDDSRTITAAADVFAWGGVVIFAGTGRIPFPADSTGAILGRIITGSPDVDGLTEPLLTLVRQALARSPADRPTARDLLDRLTTDHRRGSRPAESRTPEPSVPGVPRQLPAPPAAFSGRDGELRGLSELLTPAGGAPVAVIGGIGGIGKTWLAVRWAHDNLDRFPDGQLYANLRGFEPGCSPVPPATVLRGFLDALGVAPLAIPADLDAQAAMYRSLVADRRMLVVLDNARDSAQVVPLLPGTPAGTVLITSRHRLGALVAQHGAGPLSLGVLATNDARHLLGRHLGAARVAAEPEAVAALLSFCAGLPLALGIIAARAAADPGFSLAVLADELRQASTRLDAFDAGELPVNLRAIFASSYHALTPRAAELFRLLGAAPEPDLDRYACASLAGLPLDATRGLLRELVAGHLVQEQPPGRYRMHDLLRLYAAERAGHDEPAAARLAALRRLVGHYLHTAYAGDRLLYGRRPPISLDPPPAGITVDPPADRGAALRWFLDNHAGLLAAQALAAELGWDAEVWRLAWTMTIFHWRRGRVDHHFAVWQAGLAAAVRLGDAEGVSQAHRLLGHAYGQLGRLDAALDHLGRALDLSLRAGDLFGQGHTHQLLAWTADLRGDREQALAHAQHALRAARGLDDPVWLAVALDLVGAGLARLGSFALARRYCRQALELHREHRHPEGEADTLQSLGYIAQHTGAHTEALRAYAAALTLRRQSGDTYFEAMALERIGETHAAAGDPRSARNAWELALRLYRAQRRDERTAAMLRNLATLPA